MRLIFCCLLIFCASCKKENTTSVAESYFNEEEIANLIQMVDFVESKICPEVVGRVNCLQSYYKEISSRPDLGKTSLNAKLKPVEIFHAIKKPLRNKIWFPYRQKSADGRSLTSYNLSARGPYMNYLHQLAAFSPDQFLSYSNTLHESGNLSAAMAKEVGARMEQFDLKNFDHRLFLAIHFLTIAQK